MPTTCPAGSSTGDPLCPGCGGRAATMRKSGVPSGAATHVAHRARRGPLKAGRVRRIAHREPVPHDNDVIADLRIGAQRVRRKHRQRRSVCPIDVSRRAHLKRVGRKHGREEPDLGKIAPKDGTVEAGVSRHLARTHDLDAEELLADDAQQLVLVRVVLRIHDDVMVGQRRAVGVREERGARGDPVLDAVARDHRDEPEHRGIGRAENLLCGVARKRPDERDHSDCHQPRHRAHAGPPRAAVNAAP